MSLTHAVMWHDDDQVFRCRWGACREEYTWDQLIDAGYRARKDGVVFVNEKDFDKPLTGGVQ